MTDAVFECSCGCDLCRKEISELHETVHWATQLIHTLLARDGGKAVIDMSVPPPAGQLVTHDHDGLLYLELVTEETVRQ